MRKTLFILIMGLLALTIQLDAQFKLYNHGGIAIGDTTDPGAEQTVFADDATFNGDVTFNGTITGIVFPDTLGGSANLFDNGTSSYFTGNVGIGIAAPSARLDINNNIAYQMSSLSTAINVGMAFRIRGRNTATSTLALSSLNTDDYALQVVNDAGTVGNDLAFNPFGGNVGIGISAPETKFHIYTLEATAPLKIEGGKSTVTAVGEVNSELLFGSNDGSVQDSNQVGGKIVSVTEASNGANVGMGFYTYDQTYTTSGLTEKMRISNEGDVLLTDGQSGGTEGFYIQHDYISGNASHRLFSQEGESGGQYGFSIINAGNANPVFNGTSFTLATNNTYFIEHNNSATGMIAIDIDRVTASPKLYSSGIQRLAATSTGVSITGALGVSSRITADALTLTSSNIPINFNESGTSNYARLVFDGGNIRWDFCVDGDGLFTPYQTPMYMYKGGAVALFHNTTARITTSSSGATVTGGLTVSSHIYQGTADLHYFGTGNLSAIWHDGTNMITRSLKHGGNVLFEGEQTGGANKTMISYNPDNAVKLYYAGSSKLETSSTGVNVTGSLTASTLSLSGTLTLTNGLNVNGSSTVDAVTADGTGRFNAGLTAYQYLTIYGTFNNMSDVALKTDIQELNVNSLDKVTQLQGVTYKFINDEKRNTITGFIAQDVQKVFPELVSEVDEGLAIKTLELIPHLVEAIKEQQEIIENLEARIKILEEK